MRTLGLDYGEKRIGVAISDETGLIAQPLETITRPNARSRSHLDRIRELTSDFGVVQIVVGLPLHMNGREGEAAKAARRFGEEVREATGMALEFIDERWTTRQAMRTLDQAGIRRTRQKGRLDPVAAALLLDTWLRRRER
ncbi:MAG: Holliday junction resolvase RuvX [Myxococcales bacterium]|nr:Holliday junction resolvase RuvX [Myxococcales bacterium]